MIRIECFTCNPTILEKYRYQPEMFKTGILFNPYATRGHTQIRANGERVGFVFNIRALAEDTEPQDDEFRKIFLQSAVEALMHKYASREFIREIDQIDAEVKLSELIKDDRYFFLSLSTQQLKKAQCTVQDILISLSKDNFKDIASNLSSLRQREYENPQETIKVKGISSSLTDQKDAIKIIFDLSLNQYDSFSKYLTLYQIIEILIAKIYPQLIEYTIRRNQEKSPRELIEALTKISKEGTRIVRLYEDFLETPLLNQGYFDECKKLSNQFLDKYSPSYQVDDQGGFLLEEGKKIKKESNLNWAQAIYQVRNQVVHAQSKLINDYHEEFLEIAYYFKLCCIELVTDFKLNKK